MVNFMITGTIFKIKKFAIHDGPGIRTTLFLKGCPMSCWWCHNPEGQKFESEKMIKGENGSNQNEWVGREMTVSEVIREIEKDIIFYDESGGGATFSGGEPLSQPDFVDQLIIECKKKEINTLLDTTGFAPSDIFLNLSRKVDFLFFDLKLINDKEHIKYTGISNRLVLENLKMISKDKKRPSIHIRFPVIPGITDTNGNPERLAEFVKSLDTIQHIDILPYHNIANGKYQRLGMENKLAGLKPPGNSEVETVMSIFKSYGFSVKSGG